ncbi:hypothetical protein MDA_GLEAN10025279 [Myotis davidii]|uniref:Uncharacterized protein n=1 Tax=Myotis davidii TaxID=225400 RepID=L5LZX7_MYODS|nr:hypothetical protein MDA_GLEAN10025279 [Myotis davidii]
MGGKPPALRGFGSERAPQSRYGPPALLERRLLPVPATRSASHSAPQHSRLLRTCQKLMGHPGPGPANSRLLLTAIQSGPP